MPSHSRRHNAAKRSAPPPGLRRPRPGEAPPFEPMRNAGDRPVGSCIYYGPDLDLAVKVVVAVNTGSHDIQGPIARWLTDDGSDVRENVEYRLRMHEFFHRHGVTTFAEANQILGCPHEEEKDYPEGSVCPQCPYWANRDRWAGVTYTRRAVIPPPTADEMPGATDDELDELSPDDIPEELRALLEGAPTTEKLAMLESIIQSFDDELQLIEDDKDAYLPDFGPDPEVWLAMDEADRISRVSAYHKAAGFKAGSLRAHATIHTAVENQVALGDETPAAVTLDRLMAEGLDRHDAIHAIGRFLLILLSDMQSGSETGDVNARYEAELNTLTAKKWRSGAYDVTEDRRPTRPGRLPARRRRR